LLSITSWQAAAFLPTLSRESSASQTRVPGRGVECASRPRGLRAQLGVEQGLPAPATEPPVPELAPGYSSPTIIYSIYNISQVKTRDTTRSQPMVTKCPDVSPGVAADTLPVSIGGLLPWFLVRNGLPERRGKVPRTQACWPIGVNLSVKASQSPRSGRDPLAPGEPAVSDRSYHRGGVTSAVGARSAKGKLEPQKGWGGNLTPAPSTYGLDSCRTKGFLRPFTSSGELSSSKRPFPSPDRRRLAINNSGRRKPANAPFMNFRRDARAGT
jgi:hypothetical protein